ncbi:hypothetical protein BAUCODRAFT_558726 [Baudoinia panamericana UAMH 10762]|uniref:Uncharacterized protein n=1 Tax=Baudoinia panamericana (strain UAMH 10762) TaxID=717646 RepID=M2N6P6_BAUPA|nr:uncharacterized protein BAUCODRAFT_558726 [Baudoinia panamericana UAMH 10762]EMC94744.1 hypothetical protein BAUCODRAFT_558726 [Baudoinia panamericana UAMH 10762]
MFNAGVWHHLPVRLRELLWKRLGTLARWCYHERSCRLQPDSWSERPGCPLWGAPASAVDGCRIAAIEAMKWSTPVIATAVIVSFVSLAKATAPEV